MTSDLLPLHHTLHYYTFVICVRVCGWGWGNIYVRILYTVTVVYCRVPCDMDVLAVLQLASTLLVLVVFSCWSVHSTCTYARTRAPSASAPSANSPTYLNHIWSIWSHLEDLRQLGHLVNRPITAEHKCPSCILDDKTYGNQYVNVGPYDK